MFRESLYLQYTNISCGLRGDAFYIRGGFRFLNVCDITVLPVSEVLAIHNFYIELPVSVLACCSLCSLIAVNK